MIRFAIIVALLGSAAPLLGQQPAGQPMAFIGANLFGPDVVAAPLHPYGEQAIGAALTFSSPYLP